jgi:hypothetical protein
VGRLMTSSNLVHRMTDSSAGLAPLRMRLSELPIYLHQTAGFRKLSIKVDAGNRVAPR